MSRWVEINCSLRLCRKVHAILKQKNPNLLPDHIDIIAYRENSRKCSIAKQDKALGMKDDDKNWIAHFDDPRNCESYSYHLRTVADRYGRRTPHICVKQGFLFFPFDIPTRKKKDKGKASPSWKFCQGNWALIEVTVHELAHYIHLGHDEDFFHIYNKLLSQMAQVVISGEFYNWYSRQYQSKKCYGKGDKQTTGTKEWVDSYLAWK